MGNRNPKFQNLSGQLFALAMILGLIGYIYLLCTGDISGPYTCQPGQREISGWSGGRYIHLCESR